MKIIKVKKTFQYENIEFKIVDREEPYMNSIDPVTITRVIAPNGGLIPIQINHKETLKSIVEKTIYALENFKKLGANINYECTKQ